MRVCEHTGCTIASLSDEELEAWEVWEKTYGPLGQRRGDLQAAHATQVQIALSGSAKSPLPDVESLLLFRARDWRDPKDIEAERREREARNIERMKEFARANLAAERFKQLLREGRTGDWAKEVKNKQWIGPVTG